MKDEKRNRNKRIEFMSNEASSHRKFVLPVASFNVAGTLDGANIIGNEPAKPFVTPNAAVKMNAGVSPLMVG